jgi:hypothetical protein
MNFVKYCNTICEISVVQNINIEQQFIIYNIFIKWMVNTLCHMFLFNFGKLCLIMWKLHECFAKGKKL